VGHIAPASDDEEPFPLVGRTKRRCWYDERPDFVAFVSQTGTHGIEGEIDRSTHVLSKDESGSKFTNNSEHLEPEAGALPFKPRLFPCDAEVLTWESSVNNVNCPITSSDFSHVVDDRDTRPPPFEHLYCERFYLAERHRLYPDGVSGPVQTAD
jgi:hypothetical protein